MVSCRTCGAYIGTDHRRKYCDDDREFIGGNYRRKNYVRDFFQKNKKKYNMRITRTTGSGFSEHMRTDPKTGEPLFKKERIAVRKERRRMGI